MKGENLVGFENLSEYKINKLQHGSALYGIYTLVVCIGKLTRSLRSLVCFLIGEQLVRKYVDTFHEVINKNNL